MGGKIDKRDLMLAKFYLRDTIFRFSRLIVLLEQSNVYRADHGKMTALSGRIGALRQMHSDLTGDAQVGGGALQQVIYELEDLAGLLNDPDSQAWKHGAVLSATLQVTDNGEELIIVAPDEPEAKTLEVGLYIDRREFWVEVEGRVTIYTSNSINTESPADHLLLYGPPKYEDRWILCSPHGANASVLAYPHKLGLLFSRASSLSHVVEVATPRQIPPGGSGDTGRILVSIAEEFPGTPLSAEEDRNKPPTVAYSNLDGVQISVPDTNSVERDEISGSQTFKGHEQADRDKRDRVNSLIERSLAKFGQVDGRYTPSNTDGGETSSSQSEWGRRDVDGCVELVGQDDYRMASKPKKTVEVVCLDAGVRVNEEMSEVIEGEVVVGVRGRMEVRSHVERQLFDMGEAEVVVKANKWKDRPAREVEGREDTFEEFEQRVGQAGIEPGGGGTCRNWYHGTIIMPKAQDPLYYITEAHDLNEVQGELEVYWTANRTTRRVESAPINKWLGQAQVDLPSKAANVDDLIDGDFDLDIRLPDFEKVDDEGEDLILVHQVKEIRHGVTVPHSHLSTWRTP